MQNMMDTEESVKTIKAKMIHFAQKLVHIKSITSDEGGVIAEVYKKMWELGYDKIRTDEFGNVYGFIGSGPLEYLFDSHMDTVDAADQEDWFFDPYGGIVKDGKLYGRGSVDMKGPFTAALYAGYLAKKLGYLENKSICVSASVMEEDFEGEAVSFLLDSLDSLPKYAVICEATDLNVGRGHKGRALINITVHGKPAHASHPELGVNPAYAAQHLIGRIEQLSADLKKDPMSGSVALTKISCITASCNTIPQSVSIILDRRLSIREDEAYIRKEMNQLTEGFDAEWEICDIHGLSWKKKEVTLHSFLPAWEIPESSELVQAAMQSCQKVLGHSVKSEVYDFSTNAVATAGKYHIPTIVLGAGSMLNAHMKDEFCQISDIENACKVYISLLSRL